MYKCFWADHVSKLYVTRFTIYRSSWDFLNQEWPNNNLRLRYYLRNNIFMGDKLSNSSESFSSLEDATSRKRHFPAHGRVVRFRGYSHPGMLVVSFRAY